MTLLYLHAATTLFMAGLIWFVQVVHYPLMRLVGEPRFAQYERAHTQQTGYVVGPPMLVEAVTAFWLAIAPPSGIPPALAWFGAGLVVLIWGSTAVFQVPAHRALESAFDARSHARLVRTNWIRTIGWTTRGGVALVMFALATPLGAQTSSPSPVTPVPSVDLERYAGLWYEVARIPNRFQRNCVGEVTAFYALRDDGRVDVENRCVEADGVNRAVGLARIVNPPHNSRLEVSFFKILFWRPVWGDYWVLGLDPDYRWAIVGTPDRKYGWVLSRRRELTPDERVATDAMLRSQGYDPDAFRRIPSQ